MRGRLVPLALCIGLLAPAAPVAAVPPPPLRAEAGLAMALDLMVPLATDGRRPARQARSPGRPIDYGRDGRFTILLLGSDWRRNAGGERLDVVLVMSIDPLTGRAAAVGIPRDMVYIPRARSNGGGSSGGLRVNSIYYITYRDQSLPHEAIDRRALSRFSLDIERLLGAEIDAWAFVRFADFISVINVLGGIRIDIPAAVTDPSYHSRKSRGVYFPAQKGYLLKGDPSCRPFPRKCRSALVYARSRKGSVGDRPNNDYRRVGRHPRIVLAAVRRVVEDHGSGLMLLALLGKVRREVATSLPTTPAVAAQLYDLLKDARLSPADMRILAPGTFAYTDDKTVLYTYRPNLRAIRRWVDRAFYRVKPAPGD